MDARKLSRMATSTMRGTSILGNATSRRRSKQSSGRGRRSYGNSAPVTFRKCRPVNAVAIDLGAESCRVSVGSWHSGKLHAHIVHRFRNYPSGNDGHLYWHLNRLRCGVARGLALCSREVDGAISSIAIDGWAVDYVRLGQDLCPLGDPFCYRDLRTEQSQELVWSRISPERIYARTGIQHLRFNTLYQLYADRTASLPCHLILNIPEYLLHSLGGRPVSEFTNATHTQMVDAHARCWSDEILEAVGISRSCLPEIVPPGTELGNLGEDVAKPREIAGAKLIAPACHDTGSAVAGIPFEGNDWAFISSGTWSIVGTILPAPCITEASRNRNFSNEGGLEGQIRFLKNVNGMWLLQECIRQWSKQGFDWEISKLIEESQRLDPPKNLLPVDDPGLLVPGNMPRRINDVLAGQGSDPISIDPRDAPAVANLLFHSLAARYTEVLQMLSAVTNKTLRRVYIVGGGSKNLYLNALIAERSGLEVIRGPIESATAGNLAVQFAALEGSADHRKGVSAAAVQTWSQKLFQEVPTI